MAHKLLIIDDNHSFIDTLQVMLKGLPLHYESVFRYHDAEQKIRSGGSRINHSELQKLLLYASATEVGDKQKENSKGKIETSKEPIEPALALPQLESYPVNPDGYSMIIIEQDTEPGRKGFDFIQSILRTNPAFSAADFLLLTGKASLIEEKARAAGITVLEKPLKNNQLLPLVQARLEYLKQQEQRVAQLIERFAITVGGHSEPKATRTRGRKPGAEQLSQPKDSAKLKTEKAVKTAANSGSNKSSGKKRGKQGN